MKRAFVIFAILYTFFIIVILLIPGVQYGLLIVWIGAGIIGYISGTLAARIENRRKSNEISVSL